MIEWPNQAMKLTALGFFVLVCAAVGNAESVHAIAKVQEMHLPVYHWLSTELEEIVFPE